MILEVGTEPPAGLGVDSEPTRTRIAAPASGLLRRPPRNFVGRLDECRICWEELTTSSATRGRFIISIAGVGGIGKTTLVQRLAQDPVNAGLWIWVDERAELETVADLAVAVAEQMVSALGASSHSAHALRQLEARPAPAPNPSESGESGSRSAGLRGLTSSRVRRAHGEVASVLTEALIRDINSAERQVVLVLDTYEVLRPLAGAWLLDALLSGGLAPITGDLRIVVSGREPLQRTDPRWIRDWDTAILNLDLQPFKRHEIQAFLRGGPDANSAMLAPSVEEVMRAAEVTAGLPVWLGLWRQTWIRRGEAPDVVSAEDVMSVVERFLMWWPEPRYRGWVRLAWIPRWFNLEVLRLTLGEDADAAFDWLTQQASIVRGVGGRWSFHAVVRTALRHETLSRTPGDLARVHDSLAAFWGERLEMGVHASAERLYHLLLGTKPREGIAATYQAYVRSIDHEGVGAGAIYSAAWDARADAANADALSDLSALDLHWTAYQVGAAGSEQLAAARDRMLNLGLLPPFEQALLLASGHNLPEEADTPPAASGRRNGWLRRFRRATPSTSPNPHALEARNLVAYGDTLRLAGDYDRALRSLDRAISLDGASAQAHASRGETLRALGRLPEAIDALSAAARLAPEEAWIWGARAAAFLVVNEPGKALADADRGLALNASNAWTLAVRGMALAEIAGGATPEALSCLRRALQLDPDLEYARGALEALETPGDPLVPG